MSVRTSLGGQRPTAKLESDDKRGPNDCSATAFSLVLRQPWLREMNQGEVEAYKILIESAEALAATGGRSLEFRASPLETLPHALFLLTQLETLELTEHDLKTLPHELARLRSL